MDLINIPQQLLVFASIASILFNVYLVYMLFNKKKFSKDISLLFTFGIALISLLGSLYFSEIQKLEPCTLCWFQRIFIYPLVLIYPIAYMRKKYTKIYHYTLPLTIIGAVISLYQYMMQMMPSVFASGETCTGVSCSIFYLYEFGFVTIPFMALMAFISINLIQVIELRK